jgi:hypothetical protein
MQAKIITGDTYILRKEIKAQFGARWHDDGIIKGWIPRRTEGLEEYIKAHNLNLDDIEVPDDFFREYTEEEYREIRHTKLLKKADRYEARGNTKETKATEARKTADRIADIIPFGQPILVGHHSERRHRKDLDKIHNSMGKYIELSDDADSLHSKAGTLRRVVERENKAHEIIGTVTIDDLKRLKKDLKPEKAIKRYHNHNNTGGNFAYDLYFDKEHSRGASFELSGEHNVSGEITGLRFGYACQLGAKLDKEDFQTYTNLIEYITGVISALIKISIDENKNKVVA